MQDKLPQELLNERAALDWELQQHQAATVAATVYNSGNFLLVSQKKALKLVSTQTTVVVTAVLTN